MSNGDKQSLSDKFKNFTPKQKQYAVLGGVATVMAGLVVASTSLMDSSPPMLPQQTTQAPAPKNIAVPGQQVDPRDVWMVQSSTRMQDMENMMRDMKQKMEATEAQAKHDQMRPPAADPSTTILPPLPPLNEPPVQPAAQLPPPPPMPAVQAPEVGFAAFEVSRKPEPQKAEQTESIKTYTHASSRMRSTIASPL